MSLYANEINQYETDWNSLPLLIDMKEERGKIEQAVFKLHSRGIQTERDDWMYDLSPINLEQKITCFLTIFNQTIADENNGDEYKIKWDSDVEYYSKHGLKRAFEKHKIITAVFRPFCKLYLYFDEGCISHSYQWSHIIREKSINYFITLNDPVHLQDFTCLAANTIIDIHFTGDTQCIPLYYYNKEGDQQENITDWALQLFNDYYRQNEPASPVCYAGSSELRAEFLLDVPPANTICKEAIFQYVYAVLHHPAYRNKYALNLKREFPRIPLYDNFHQWAAWGKKLMDLHVHYETVAPYPLERKDVMMEPKAGVDVDSSFKAKLKAHKEKGEIEIDAVTTLSNIPTTAWDYQLGNRSALEWILDQYKEKKPGDPTIAEHFNTYRFHEYKEHVIDLLQRVCTVSIETMKVIGEMP